VSEPSSRHISPQTLDDYVAAGVAASIPITGEPDAVLTVDSPNQTLRLEISWDGEQPPAISDYVHISTDVRFRQGRNWATIAVHGTRFFAEGYPLLRSVADLVQLETATFATAVERSLASYHDLLAATGQMPVREEIGLYGEVLVISHLISTIGPAAALNAWRGGDQTEEHDLGLADDDVEIKTTTAESRRHWISTLDQLKPTVGRRLWLLSIQLTGAGASDAERLPDVIARVEAQLPVGLRSTFQSRLARSPYRPGQPHDSFRLLRLRSAPACFLVDGDFPRIDHDILLAGGATVAAIDDVNYVIRLDGRTPAADPPAPLRDLGLEDT
jgi:hypothetical protein